MPNPQGTNGAGVYEPEQPYGQIKRLQELVKQAPLPPTSALNAPERAQRKAARPPAGQQAAASQPQPVPPTQPLPYSQRLARILQGLPGADGSLPNITWLAQQAAKEASA